MRHDPSLSVSSPATLADVIDRLNADDGLTKQTRREMVSAVNQVAKFAQLPPSSVLLDIPELRTTLEDVQPRRYRMSSRRLTNIRSLFVKALIRAGAEVEPLRLNAELLPQWATLLEKLSSPNDINAFARFSQWCSMRDVEPIAVDDDVVATYREVLTRKTFVKNAAKSVQNLIRSWNRCRKSVDGWPRVELTVIIRREIYLLPVETFPSPSRRISMPGAIAWAAPTCSMSKTSHLFAMSASFGTATMLCAVHLP